MILYFNGMKNPLLPLRFAALGIKLMLRGKVSLRIPSHGNGALTALFRKAGELEEAG